MLLVEGLLNMSSMKGKDLKNATPHVIHKESDVVTEHLVFNTLAAYPIASLETADRVLIHSMGHTGPMVAEKEYQLQCDIVNVAPVQNLTVRWYQGDVLFKDQGR